MPSLAERGSIPHEIIDLAWEANQALAGLGVIAAGAAILLWSLDFLGRGGAEARVIGTAGLIAGTLPAVLLIVDVIEMNFAGAFLAYALQAAWGAAVGFHLVRRKAAPTQEEARPIS